MLIEMRALVAVGFIVAQAACVSPEKLAVSSTAKVDPAQAMENCRGKMWSRAGARVQMEADGEMPMSITTVQHPQTSDPSGCAALIEIHSKTALAAMLEPPILTDQRNWVAVSPLGASPAVQIQTRGEINASGYYARAYGTSESIASGIVSYAGVQFHEGLLLDGAEIRSSVSLKIYARDSGVEFAELHAPAATVSIGPRRVGRSELIETAFGPKACFPITYEKRTSLGSMEFLGEVGTARSAISQITDWYCPSEDFVLRTDVRQSDRTQRVETTDIVPVEDTQSRLP